MRDLESTTGGEVMEMEFCRRSVSSRCSEMCCGPSSWIVIDRGIVKVVCLVTGLPVVFSSSKDMVDGRRLSDISLGSWSGHHDWGRGSLNGCVLAQCAVRCACPSVWEH